MEFRSFAAVGGLRAARRGSAAPEKPRTLERTARTGAPKYAEDTRTKLARTGALPGVTRDLQVWCEQPGGSHRVAGAAQWATGRYERRMHADALLHGHSVAAVAAAVNARRWHWAGAMSRTCGAVGLYI